MSPSLILLEFRATHLSSTSPADVHRGVESRLRARTCFTQWTLHTYQPGEASVVALLTAAGRHGKARRRDNLFSGWAALVKSLLPPDAAFVLRRAAWCKHGASEAAQFYADARFLPPNLVFAEAVAQAATLAAAKASGPVLVSSDSEPLPTGI